MPQSEEGGCAPARRRMHIADVGTLLTNSTRRQMLIMCSVVPDFTAADVVEALDEPRAAVDDVICELLRLGAIYHIPGPAGTDTYTVQGSVRDVILSAVRGGFADSTTRRAVE
jgi:hypothetical protein